MRSTSIKAYHEVTQEGKIAQRDQEVINVLNHNSHITSNEIFDLIKKMYNKTLRFDSNTRARLTGLRRAGVVREVGKRACTITGRTCIIWELTGNKPQKFIKRMGRKELEHLALKALEHLYLAEDGAAMYELEKIATNVKEATI